MRGPRHSAWSWLAVVVSVVVLAACGSAPPGAAPVDRAPATTDPVPGGTVPSDVVGPGGSRELGLAEDLQYLTGADLDARLDAYAALGVQWARFQLIWANVQRSSASEWSWSTTDAVVGGLRARGIKVLAVLTTTPPWADRAPGCDADTCAPTDPAEFARFAGAAAARYAGQVQAWEVWNEPNIDVFYNPSPDPVAYAGLLRAASAAVRAADPAATVVSGGPAPADDATDPADGRVLRIEPVAFLSRVYAAGAGGSFDAVGWHPYSYPTPPGGSNPTSTWVQMYGPPASVRELMRAHGDEGKAIWGTEFGAPTAPGYPGALTETQQAQQLGGGVDLWRSYAWAGPLFLYQLRDRGTDPDDREDYFGLQRFDGSPKPAYGAIAARVDR